VICSPSAALARYGFTPIFRASTVPETAARYLYWEGEIAADPAKSPFFFPFFFLTIPKSSAADGTANWGKWLGVRIGSTMNHIEQRGARRDVRD
jgi:hypothetical protein